MPDADSSERPTYAGAYDYALGGSANTAADRAVVERAKRVLPHVAFGAWANRGFLQRAVKRMAQEWGIRQFLDIGAGMPTQRNTHEVVADVTRAGRVVYVDNDPSVIDRANRMLAGMPNTAAVHADLRHPDQILDHPQTRRLVNFAEPVGLLLVAVTHFLSDTDDPWGLVGRYVQAVAPGSYLALSAVTSDRQEEQWAAVQRVNPDCRLYPRTRAQVEKFFEGLQIAPPYAGAEPVVGYVGVWGAEDPEAADDDGSRLAYAAVARKP